MAMAPNDLNANREWSVADHLSESALGVATLRRPGQRLRRFFWRSASCLKESNARGTQGCGGWNGPKIGGDPWLTPIENG